MSDNRNTAPIKNTAAAAIASGSITAVIGAAFLMATSTIGPGFLNNTVVFTKQYMGAMFILIVICVGLDVVIHQNVWRPICYTGKRGQDVANDLCPGLGYFFIALIGIVGFIANIGNVGGVALALQMLVDINPKIATLIGGGVSLSIFLSNDIKAAMDKLTIFLGALMIMLCLYVAITSAPPISKIPADFANTQFSDMLMPIIAIVGGSAGAYLSLAGPHRLIDAGVTGPENNNLVVKSAILGCGVGAIMRILLFLAAFGVLSKAGVMYDTANPAASVFKSGAGSVGYIFFGVVLFAAATTSVVGCSFTCVSLLKSLHRVFTEQEKYCIIIWIVLSTLLMTFAGRPAKVLVISGVVNGLILPAVLAIMLLVSRSKRLMGKDYRHPFYLTILGWLVVVATGYAAVRAIPSLLKLF
ncbi:MAG: divalent metal cation transporter [Synergistaceae bacterium]|nr:divalent metal cation transporter [Synergistaceae bacterium]